MEELKKLEGIMENMVKRLEANKDDEEARAIFDRCAELVEALWKDEVR